TAAARRARGMGVAARVARGRVEVAQQQVARFRQRRRRQPLEELVEQHEVERGLGALVHQLRDGQADGAGDPPWYTSCVAGSPRAGETRRSSTIEPLPSPASSWAR